MTRQFDVFRNPLRAGREQRPFVIAMQHAFFDRLPTRVVMPLVVKTALDFQPRLNPVFNIQGRQLHLSPTEPFALSIRFLRDPIDSLASERDRIVAALDLVFTGI
ncbi:MAG: CcdB family protein [Rhizomicrobium sp.]